MSAINLTPSLCRAARALLGWQQRDVSEKSGVPKSTLGVFEAKDDRAYLPEAHNDALIVAFETAGLMFIHEDKAGAGVRFSKPSNSSAALKIRFTVDGPPYLADRTTR